MGVENIEFADFDEAVHAAFDGKESKLSPEEANKLIQEYLQELTEKKAAEIKAVGQKFLEENRKNEKVQETASGLQYIVEKEGTGAQPTASDEVTVHYTGKLLDGTVFDSSVSRGEPATFPPQPRDPRLDRGCAAHERGRKIHILHPL